MTPCYTLHGASIARNYAECASSLATRYLVGYNTRWQVRWRFATSCHTAMLLSDNLNHGLSDDFGNGSDENNGLE